VFLKKKASKKNVVKSGTRARAEGQVGGKKWGNRDLWVGKKEDETKKSGTKGQRDRNGPGVGERTVTSCDTKKATREKGMSKKANNGVQEKNEPKTCIERGIGRHTSRTTQLLDRITKPCKVTGLTR